MNKFPMNRLLTILSYVLVAVLASVLTLAFYGNGYSKLNELEQIIQKKFIDEVDMTKVEDAAAEAMVEALGNRWSYYISAEEYAAFQEDKNNTYVGVGITIRQREDGTGFDILEVAPGGSAKESGIHPGDILVEVAGQDATELDVNSVSNLIRGDAGTFVEVKVIRDGELLEFSLERKEIRVQVAAGQMLEGNIGLVKIKNFNSHCADETIAAVEALLEQGAEGLIFDVRNNPGGYVSEMLEVLDYLLPEGVLYRDLDYNGNRGEETSDANCIELPMAVLVNGSSYSAAEFFAACMQEFEWAEIVGEPTTGKGHYQNTLRLMDGSAVNLSTGKYFTPSGINLTEVGGLIPDVTVEVDEETAALIYSELLEAAEDPQIQAAWKAVVEKNG